MGNTIDKLTRSSDIAIDAASSNLRVVQGSYNQKSGLLQIAKASIVPLEPDTISDGVIADQFGVVMALKNTLAKLDISSRRAIFSVEGSYLHTRDLELPAVKPIQLRDMIRYEILGQSNTNRDMIVEYIIYGSYIDEETKQPKYKIRATAIPKEIASDIRDLMKSCSLTPVALDVNPNAIRKLFQTGMINGHVNIEASTLLLIELSSKTTNITVLDKGFPVLSRRLQFGHSSIHQVAETVKKMQSNTADKSSILTRRLQVVKGEPLKPLELSDIDVWNETVKDEPSLLSAVTSYFKSLTEAVSRTAQFSISKYGLDSISTCFIYGSGAAYKKMDKEMSRQLGTQVEVLTSLSNVVAPKDFVLAEYVNACGALIREG
ncbi:MAG: pilus assembly protein PilM [Eubacteriales bacterium]